jgi:GNAT superfamily N-acetyltransferase
MTLHPLPETVLSLEVMGETIERACQTTIHRWEHNDRFTLRSVEGKDLAALLTFLSVTTVSLNDTCRDFLDMYHGIVSEDKKDGTMCAAAIFYVGYSTWDSRFLCIDHILADEGGPVETSFMYTLADIAKALDCHRLVWKNNESKSAYYRELNAESLNGWLTLRMDETAIDVLLATKEALAPTAVVADNFTLEATTKAIDDALAATNTILERCGLKLHRATEKDVDDIEAQVAGLALYEKEPESVHVTKEHYRIDGYQTDHPLFHCILLQDTETKKFHGLSFFYFGYDFDQGRFLYLEDLFFEESHRGRGGGFMIMYTLASVCKRLGCTGFMWQALDWNTPAITFYKKIGATILDGLLSTRFAGAQLTTFINNRPGNQ